MTKDEAYSLEKGDKIIVLPSHGGTGGFSEGDLVTFDEIRTNASTMYIINSVGKRDWWSIQRFGLLENQNTEEYPIF